MDRVEYFFLKARIIPFELSFFPEGNNIGSTHIALEIFIQFMSQTRF